MLEQVSARVWVTTSPTWLTTSTVVVDDDGACLVVDPALTPADLVSLQRELTDRGWHVAAAFSTHPHWDHTLWSEALPDVPRWATPAAAAACTDEELAAQAARDLPGHRWDVVGGTTPLPPDTTELPWTGPRAVVVATPGHAPGHASLHLPGERVLLAGDMLSDVEVPLLDDGPGAVDAYRRSLQRLADVVAGCDAVVPGHGRVTDAAAASHRLAADHRYLDDLTAGAEPLDPRLGDQRVRAEHEAQAARLPV
ncbi:Glyoxylase, beta-lactamase superfamily II [Georgenia satyanarayanai]|uniref:Glyoxylase, beta-lactamase superfamily II n=1 Tax=Georgenia satyanarayanai TaxID=860221 RepID=A0A2Y8ZW26_9MICO|nr:MBL fold metallo-hydrolase [Georgenia satyanarayanai]PYG01731.1 glyoxylase-like metal-dependent hydrolase (beta-lactamase superfamily II) [Georgenia satyanarayanai]SSA36531.1 Glyoxylase, beta-lactamase superfamily II [Georgenia satyanarayanai]